ncbi:retinoic acid receptor gamma-like isoform X2 [Panulirus ornatus]|uniref:retinoic acid receptor gamma-like isoform X2 n=1 Tax=Panulirus ornatus TaxID=150431 RepID=UPI003A84013E
MPSDHEKTFGDNLYVPCAVCGDRASGVHYRVYTCEGCKVFFRRTHLRKQLVCKKGNCCLINKQTRRYCKACRYQKCLHAGMVMEEIFLKRLAMKSKLKDKQKSQPWSDLTKTLSTAYHESFIVAYKAHSMLKDYHQTANKELRVVGSIQARQFALKVPGLSTLSQTTQQVVLGHAVSELMVLHLASRFVLEQNGFRVSEGHFLPVAVVVEILGRPLTLKIIRFAIFLIYAGFDETESCNSFRAALKLVIGKEWTLV